MSLFFILDGWIPSGQTFYMYLYIHTYASHFLYPFICQWTLRLLLCLDFCEWCCSKHRRAHVFEIPVSVPLNICWEMGLLDHIVILLLIFRGTSIWFYIWPHHFSADHMQSFQYLYIPLIIVILMNVRWYLIVVLICPCLVSVMLSIFSYVCFGLCVVFVEMFAQVLCQLFIYFCYWVVEVLYVFLILIPYQIHCLLIFSPIP